GDQQDGCDGGTERDRSLGRDVREIENAEAHVDAQGQDGQDQADRQRTEDERHDREPPSTAPIGPIQHAPCMNSLCPAPTRSRSSWRRWSSVCGDSVSNSPRTVSCTSTWPFRMGRYEKAAACMCPAGKSEAPNGRSSGAIGPASVLALTPAASTKVLG